MLISQNQLVSELEFLSRVHVFVAGKPANDHDARQFQSVTLLRYGLEADLLGLDAVLKCTHRRSIHNIHSVDLRWYAEDFKTLKQAYLRHLSGDPGLGPWRSFKRCVAGQLHYRWMLSTLANLFDDAKSAVQWLSFDERLLLTTNENDIADEIQSYLDFETQLSDIVYPKLTTEALRSIVADWFSDFSLAAFPVQCKFGPGAVSEWRGRLPELRKAERLVYDQNIVSEMASIMAVDEGTLIPGSPGRAPYTNRIIFRPKNALKHRIISAEPTWLTWLQQGIKNPVYAFVNAHKRMFTNFSDQGQSRRLAQLGSVDGSYATIDFSNASDSVTVELVVDVFRDTDLLWPLLATRSCTALLPDGRTCNLAKFAPMGSATCFLTMDIIFLSMCELSIRQTYQRHGRPDDYVVFGDDVIIRSEAYPAFAELAEQLHFKLNDDKSFSSSATPHFYRESCGIEAYDGADITPFRYSRFQEPIVEWASCSSQLYVTSNVDNLNRLLVDYAYYQTRSMLWQVIKLVTDRAGRHAREVWDHVKRVDLSDDDASPAPLRIVVPDGTATNYRTEKRWNRDLQRAEILCTQWVAKPRKAVASQQSLLLWLWCSHAESSRPSSTEPIGENEVSDLDFVAAANGTSDPQWSLGWYAR